MFIIGLTGIIGSGKSTVAKLFKEEYGATIIDADAIGHHILEHDQAVQTAVLQEFGTINRSQLAHVVFNNRGKLHKLNTITHPAIKHAVQQDIQKATTTIIIIDAALLFPIGLNEYCHACIFIDAPEQLIFERLIQRGLKAEDIQLRLKANQSVYQLQSKCQHTLINDGDMQNIRSFIDHYLQTRPVTT